MDKPFRLLPELTDLTRPFWTSGERGELVMQACTTCDYIIHPAAPYCPECGGREVAPRVLTGRATVYSVTVNTHVWNPTMPPAYAIANVIIEDQADVHLTTNIVNIDPYEVTIGMPVTVLFENHEDVWIPLFEPAVDA
jgi:uncharacterized OB-fold protein